MWNNFSVLVKTFQESLQKQDPAKVDTGTKKEFESWLTDANRAVANIKPKEGELEGDVNLSHVPSVALWPYLKKYYPKLTFRQRQKIMDAEGSRRKSSKQEYDPRHRHFFENQEYQKAKQRMSPGSHKKKYGNSPKAPTLGEVLEHNNKKSKIASTAQKIQQERLQHKEQAKPDSVENKTTADKPNLMPSESKLHHIFNEDEAKDFTRQVRSALHSGDYEKAANLVKQVKETMQIVNHLHSGDYDKAMELIEAKRSGKGPETAPSTEPAEMPVTAPEQKPERDLAEAREDVFSYMENKTGKHIKDYDKALQFIENNEPQGIDHNDPSWLNIMKQKVDEIHPKRLNSFFDTTKESEERTDNLNFENEIPQKDNSAKEKQPKAKKKNFVDMILEHTEDRIGRELSDNEVESVLYYLHTKHPDKGYTNRQNWVNAYKKKIDNPNNLKEAVSQDPKYSSEFYWNPSKKNMFSEGNNKKSDFVKIIDEARETHNPSHRELYNAVKHAKTAMVLAEGDGKVEGRKKPINADFLTEENKQKTGKKEKKKKVDVSEQKKNFKEALHDHLGKIKETSSKDTIQTPPASSTNLEKLPPDSSMLNWFTGYSRNKFGHLGGQEHVTAANAALSHVKNVHQAKGFKSPYDVRAEGQAAIHGYVTGKHPETQQSWEEYASQTAPAKKSQRGRPRKY